MNIPDSQPTWDFLNTHKPRDLKTDPFFLKIKVKSPEFFEACQKLQDTILNWGKGATLDMYKEEISCLRGLITPEIRLLLWDKFISTKWDFLWYEFIEKILFSKIYSLQNIDFRNPHYEEIKQILIEISIGELRTDDVHSSQLILNIKDKLKEKINSLKDWDPLKWHIQGLFMLPDNIFAARITLLFIKFGGVPGEVSRILQV